MMEIQDKLLAKHKQDEKEEAESRRYGITLDPSPQPNYPLPSHYSNPTQCPLNKSGMKKGGLG